jgi:hypothetical protein
MAELYVLQLLIPGATCVGVGGSRVALGTGLEVGLAVGPGPPGPLDDLTFR